MVITHYKLKQTNVILTCKDRVSGTIANLSGSKDAFQIFMSVRRAQISKQAKTKDELFATYAEAKETGDYQLKSSLTDNLIFPDRVKSIISLMMHGYIRWSKIIRVYVKHAIVHWNILTLTLHRIISALISNNSCNV